MELRFCGGPSLLPLPGLTIGRSLQELLEMQALEVRVTAGGRWQIVTPGTRAPRLWARGAASGTAFPRAFARHGLACL